MQVRVDCSRVRLLASSSMVALLVGSGALPAYACLTQNGGTVASVTATGNCVILENGATVTGNVTNSGTIHVGGGDGIGIVSSTVGGAVTNSGTISGAGAGMLVAGNANVAGGVVNSGTVSMVGQGFISGFGAQGIAVANVNTYTGGINNAAGGTITAGSGTGILVYSVSTFTGGITNSGSVSGDNQGIAISGARTSGGGVVFATSFGGGINNNGTITAGSYGLTVYGLSTFTGGITNTGRITVSGDYYGIMVDSVAHFGSASLGGGITNSGIIVARTGIAVGAFFGPASTVMGGITNSGGASISAVGAGIDVGWLASFAGGITNAGTISAGASGIGVVKIQSFSGNISNAGTISSRNFGIVVGGLNTSRLSFRVRSFEGNITNSGTITAKTGILVQNAGISGAIVDSGIINASHIGIIVRSQASVVATRMAVAITGPTFTGGITNTGTIAGATGLFIGSQVSTFTGAISNSGTISGAGGTAIDVSAAHDAISINQSAGLIAGDIKLSANADVLDFTGGTISGNIVGAGSSDTVNVALGADNTLRYGAAFTGINQFNINSGTVILDGANSATNVDVNAGTLAGTGTIAASAVTIHTGATFAPGTPGIAGSSMTINGSLSFQTGTTYAVQVNPTAASSANVSGTAALAGNVLAGFAPGSYVSKDYLILQSTGLSGTFASLTTSGMPTGFHATLAYNGGDVFLDLAPQLTTAGLNGNQANVAAGILNAFNAGAPLPPGFLTLFALPSANQTSALAELSGQQAIDARKGASQLTADFLVTMLDLSLEGRGGAAGPLPFAPDAAAALPFELASAYASVLKAPAAPPRPALDQRWSAWGAAFGGYNSTKGDPAVGSNDVVARDYGFAAGMDYRVAPDTIVGFALAGAGTNWGLAQGLGGGRSDAFQAGLYGRTELGAAYVASALAFANHWFTTSRTALGDQLTAKFDGQSYAARLEGGWRYALQPTLGITPYAALQSQLFRTPAYSESDLTGGAFGLAYNAVSASDTRSELGARFDSLQIVAGMPLILRGRLAWARDWVSNPTVGAAFEALPGAAFTVNGAAPPRNSTLTATSAELKLSADWSLTARFEGELGNGAQTYTGTGVLRHTW
ncbi:MAG TPA: autotransporter domain-containing protein [Xanthobacteraceae bacterium]|nr:autotransporter domain-containing protein [Xanthobacteraceae bacterium]